MKINVRLLIILLVAGVVTLTGIFVLYTIQIRRHDAGFLARARAGIESENPSERQSGLRHYRIYLSRHTEEPDVRAEYGIALKKYGYLNNAIEQLERAVRGNPENKDALKALADLMMYQAHRYSDARRHLESLTKLENKNLEYRQQLAQCLILENNFSKAEKILQEIIKEDPTQLVSYKILSELYDLKLKRPEDSQKIIDQMVEKNPKAAEAYRLRALHLFGQAQKEPDQEKEDAEKEKANQDLEKALELDPKDKSILLLASTLSQEKGNFDAAKKFAQRLIEADPQSQDGYLQMAKLEVANINLEKSLEWIQKGIDATGGTHSLLFQKADRLLDLNKVAEAKQEIKKLSKVPFNPILYSYLEARTDYAEEKWAKARERFETVRPELERLKGLRFLVPRVDVFTAECYRQLGNPEKGQELTSQALHSNVPTLTKDPLEQGRLLRQEGKLIEAINYFKRLTQNEQIELSAYIELFPLLIQQALLQEEANRDWSAVDNALAKIQELLPDDPRAALLQVQAIIAKDKENTKEAEDVLDAAVKRAKARAKQWDKLLEELGNTPKSEDAVQLLRVASESWAKKNRNMDSAIEFLEKGNRERALKILEVERENQADTRRLWLTRIAIARSQEDWDRAEEITRKAILTLGDSAAFRKALAAITVKRGGDDVQVRLETVLQDIDKLPENEQQDLWKFVAVLFNQMGKNDRAIELCEIAAKKDPNNLFIRQTLFALALEAGNKEVMDRTLKEIGKIDQQGPTWNYLTALEMSYPIVNQKTISDEDRETLEAAIDHLNVAEVQRPNWGKAALLLGKLYDKVGNTKAAETNLAQAVEFGERDPTGLARLAEIYIRGGRTLEAQTILNMMRYSTQGLNPAGQIAMAKLKLQRGDKRGAMAELMGAVEMLRKEAAESEEAKDYLSLAQVLSNAAALSRQIDEEELADKLFQEAKDMVVKASEVDPTDYRPWLILAKLYKDQGKNRQVEEVVMELKNNVPEEMLQIALSKCYETLGRTVEAELACEKALEVASEKNDIAKEVASFYLRSDRDKKNDNENAEKVLRQILDGKLPASNDDIIWARRRLALILFTRGLQKNRAEAMKLIAENLKANTNSLLDLRVQARGLAVKGTRKDKKRSIEMFEDLVKRPSPSSEDRFQLAKLYWTDGNWNGTSAQMQVLLGSASPKPDWYEFYIRCLIDRDEFSSAQTNWQKLASMRPNAFTTAELAAYISAGMNQPQKAVKALEAFLNDSKATPDNELVKLTLSAKTAEGLATQIQQNDEAAKKTRQLYLDFAEKCYRSMAEKYSKYEMALASFLGRYNKRDQAIDLAEKAWKTNQPQTIAAATVRLLNTGEATPKQIERVEKILNDAEEHFGDRVALDLAKAELCTLQKQYDEAERLYREVLKADKENAVALNNLSVFLALRKVKLDEALKSINKAIEIAGPQATLLDSRASVYLARGEYQKALDDIDAALQERRSAVRFFHQAQIQLAAGDKEGAKKSLEQALDLGIQVEQLQPLERPGYRALRESLK